MNKFIKQCLNKPWLPFIILIIFIFAWNKLSIIMPLGSSKTFLLIFVRVIYIALTFFTIFVSLVSLWNKKWVAGLINLGLGILLIIIPLFLYYFVSNLFNPRAPEDHFSKNVTIPADMIIHEVPESLPKEFLPEGAAPRLLYPLGAFGKFRDSKNVILTTIDSPNTPISVGCEFLDRFSGSEKDTLIRHMATSAYWFLTDEFFHRLFTKKMSGHLYAYRTPSLKSPHHINIHEILFTREHAPYKNSRPTALSYTGISLDGTIGHDYKWRKKLKQKRIPVGEQAIINPDDFNRCIAIKGNNAILEINERSPKEKTILPFLLKEIEDEFKKVLESPIAKGKGFDPALMPPGSIKYGKPEMTVVGDWHAYSVFAYINPGEPGYVYTKIFEATRNIPLSGYAKAPLRSMCYIGWSDNPEELFYYRIKVLIAEGDPEDFYPARFELWFVPNSGGQERKLLEKIYSVSGYSR